ncbi:MAG: NmrA/HSCARG family protein [Pseudomonadota bacterium]
MIGREGKTIVVFGATGKQGGAVIDALEDGPTAWHVKAVTRDAGSANARALAARKVTLVAGDMDDVTGLTNAMEGAEGVFSVQANFENDHDGREIRFGQNVVNAARKAGVSHLVYGSVGGAERDTGVPHFVSKRQIERHLIESGVPFTILRPASFMDNFASFAMRIVLLSMFKTIMSPHTKLQLVATKDIGRFAARAFEHPTSHRGRQIELAGDALTVPEIIRTLRQGGVKPTFALRLPSFVVGKLPADFPIMVQWFEDQGFNADIDALRGDDPQLMTLADWTEAR